VRKTKYTTLQHTATHCNSLQHTAAHCNTLPYPAIPYSTLHYTTLHHTATHVVLTGAVRFSRQNSLSNKVPRSPVSSSSYTSPTFESVPTSSAISSPVLMGLDMFIYSNVCACIYVGICTHIHAHTHTHTHTHTYIHLQVPQPLYPAATCPSQRLQPLLRRCHLYSGGGS